MEDSGKLLRSFLDTSLCHWSPGGLGVDGGQGEAGGLPGGLLVWGLEAGGGPPGGLLLELEGGGVPPGGWARGLALGRGGTPAQGPQ